MSSFASKGMICGWFIGKNSEYDFERIRKLIYYSKLKNLHLQTSDTQNGLLIDGSELDVQKSMS